MGNIGCEEQTISICHCNLCLPPDFQLRDSCQLFLWVVLPYNRGGDSVDFEKKREWCQLRNRLSDARALSSRFIRFRGYKCKQYIRNKLQKVKRSLMENKGCLWAIVIVVGVIVIANLDGKSDKGSSTSQSSAWRHPQHQAVVTIAAH